MPQKFPCARPMSLAALTGLLIAFSAPQPSHAATTTVTIENLVPIQSRRIGSYEDAWGGTAVYFWERLDHLYALPEAVGIGQLVSATLVLSANLSVIYTDAPGLSGNIIPANLSVSIDAGRANDIDVHAADLLSTSMSIDKHETLTWHLDVTELVAAAEPSNVKASLLSSKLYSSDNSLHLSHTITASAEYEYAPAPIPLPGSLPLAAGGLTLLAALRRRKT